MASVQEAGLVRIVAKKPSGAEIELFSSHVTVSAPGGGSPDAAGTSTPKINERLFVPVHPAVLRDNDIIFVEFTSENADGIDVADMLWAIPLKTTSGVKHISLVNFQNPAPAAYTAVVGIPTRVGGYKIVEGRAQFGGGSLYLDFQDDT